MDTKHFAGKRVKIERLKPPTFIRDDEGKILHMGNLVVALKMPNGNTDEVDFPCTRELFSQVYKSKAWRAVNQEINVQFNSEGIADAMFFKSTHVPVDRRGDKLTPPPGENEEIDLKSFVDFTETTKDKEVLIRILPKADAKGLKIQLIESEDVPEAILSDILTAVNTAALNNTKLQDKDILEDRFMINRVANNGTYIYVRATPLNK